MIALKRILVPTDFSDASLAAVKYGRAFADAFSASLHLLHVFENPFVFASGAEGFVPPPSMLEEIERTGVRRLNETLAAADREKFHAQIVTRKGSPFLEIVRYAKEQDIDLIVMGTHGRGPIAHMLMGSVAEKVVRKAPCPVLTVRHPEHEFVMP